MPPKPRGRTSWKMVVAARELRQNETGAEEVLWSALRGKHLNGVRFRRQHPVGNYVLDFFCVKYQLGIELDGDILLQPEQAGYDEQRTKWLQEQNIRILRFRNEDVFANLPRVLEEILNTISEKNTFS
jgi:5-methyltetrahydrofolate--homocysteine methyltransferase